MGLFSVLAPVVGGLLGLGASNKAAKTQAKSADAAVAEQRRQFDVTRQDFAPWMESGRNALSRLQDPNAYASDPMYQGIVQAGTKNIGNSFAARGGAFSGNALRALQQNNLGALDQWWNRNTQLAGLGQQATGNVANFGANASGNIGNALMAQGDARASGISGGANSLSQGLSGAFDAFDYFRTPGINPNANRNRMGPWS
jgi:hypothetical protein